MRSRRRAKLVLAIYFQTKGFGFVLLPSNGEPRRSSDRTERRAASSALTRYSDCILPTFSSSKTPARKARVVRPASGSSTAARSSSRSAVASRYAPIRVSRSSAISRTSGLRRRSVLPRLSRSTFPRSAYMYRRRANPGRVRTREWVSSTPPLWHGSICNRTAALHRSESVCRTPDRFLSGLPCDSII
jgi:hypothetical protein